MSSVYVEKLQDGNDFSIYSDEILVFRRGLCPQNSSAKERKATTTVVVVGWKFHRHYR